MRWLSTPADIHTWAREVNGRMVSTRNRTYVFREAMQPHARSYVSLTQVYVYMYIYIYTHTHTQTDKYTSDPPVAIYGGRHKYTHTHARTQALVATHNARERPACTTGDPYQDDDL